MLTLVKTMKSMGLSNRMDWTKVNRGVLGVQFVNDAVPVMVFKTPGYGETRLFSANHSNTVAFMTLHEPISIDRICGENIEGDILERILESSGINTSLQRQISVTKTLYNYFVFELNHNGDINNLVLEYRLRSRGIKTIMEFDVHGALVVDMEDIKWHFFNSGKAFAIVGGVDLKKSTEIVQGSWEDIKIYT